ncbi:hypothetical protein AAVH_17260, partial [Aphelenchoides avenae]
VPKIGLAAIPFLKDFKDPGQDGAVLDGQPKGFDPDCIDRLNGYVVPCFLLLCIGVNSASNFGWMGGEPMKCLA